MASKRDTIKNIFVQNWGLKLMALILALLTFYAIRGVTNEELTYEVPVIVDVEEGIAILDLDPPSVKVTFRGSSEDLRVINANKLEARIKPTMNATDDSSKTQIRIGNIKGAVGARAVKIVPNVASLTFDTEDEQTFPVAKPITTGTPLIGKIEVDYEPKEVIVRGPKRQLRRMREKAILIETGPIDVDERVKSFTRAMPALSPSDTWVAKIEPSEIKVTVNIVTESISRKWTDLNIMAVMESHMSMDVECIPPTCAVTVHGRPELVESITDESIKVFVDCSGLKHSKEYKLPVNVHLPPSAADVTVKVEPDLVKVKLTKQSAVNNLSE